MPQPKQSMRIATRLMLELAEVRKRLEAAEAVVEAARRLKGDIGYHDDTPLGDALAAYDKLKGGDAQ